MDTELPEDVLVYLRHIATAYGQVGIGATALLAKYDPSKWQLGDIVRDDSSNLFCYGGGPYRGWHGLASNQPSARGPVEYDDLAQPLVLLVRDGKPVSA